MQPSPLCGRHGNVPFYRSGWWEGSTHDKIPSHVRWLLQGGGHCVLLEVRGEFFTCHEWGVGGENPWQMEVGSCCPWCLVHLFCGACGHKEGGLGGGAVVFKVEYHHL